MSYQVTIVSVNFSDSREFEGVGLRSALEEMGAKTVSYGGLGSFIEKIGGDEYKEDGGGIYTWLLSKNSNGESSPVDYGLDLLTPEDGDHYFATYEFIPDSKPEVGPNYDIVEVHLPEEIDFPEYTFVKAKPYFEPENISYDEFDTEIKDESSINIDIFSQTTFVPMLENYEVFDFGTESRVPALTRVDIPQKIKQKRIIFEKASDSELESFLMGVLSEAKNMGVLAKLEAKESTTPFILA